MQDHKHINLNLSSQVEWPSLPQRTKSTWDPESTWDPDATWPERQAWAKETATWAYLSWPAPEPQLYAPRDHFHYQNPRCKRPSGNERLVGYAAAVRQGLSREPLLRRIAQTGGQTDPPVELKLEILSHVFCDWDISVKEGYIIETEEDPVTRLFHDCQDLEDLRSIALTAARESVTYQDSYMKDWDAITLAHETFATHNGRHEIRNFRYTSWPGPELELLFDLISGVPDKYDSINPNIKFYKEPEEARKLLAPMSALRHVTFAFRSDHEHALLAELLEFDHQGVCDRLRHLCNSLLAMKKFNPRTKVALETVTRDNTYSALNIQPDPLPKDVWSELLGKLKEICDHDLARQQYEMDILDQTMSD